MKLYFQIIFIILLAVTVNSFVYFGFTNSYSTSILNYTNFTHQFDSGIYQYRKLSGFFLKEIYQLLGNWDIDYSIFKLKFLKEDAEPRMYLALYLLNTIFLALCSVVMVVLAQSNYFNLNKSEKILLPTIGVFSIIFTQFALSPYDCSSYFLLMLFMYFLLNYTRSQQVKTLITMLVILIISTTNRESSALSISLATTILYVENGLKKKSILPIVFMVVAFVITYLGLRFFSNSYSTNDGVLVEQNFKLMKNLLGISFWILFFGLTIFISNSKENTKAILLFHVFSAPYIFMCFFTGILYEIRLYVPLFLTSLFLSKYTFKKN